MAVEVHGGQKQGGSSTALWIEDSPSNIYTPVQEVKSGVPTHFLTRDRIYRTPSHSGLSTESTARVHGKQATPCHLDFRDVGEHSPLTKSTLAVNTAPPKANDDDDDDDDDDDGGGGVGGVGGDGDNDSIVDFGDDNEKKHCVIKSSPLATQTPVNGAVTHHNGDDDSDRKPCVIINRSPLATQTPVDGENIHHDGKHDHNCDDDNDKGTKWKQSEVVADQDMGSNVEEESDADQFGVDSGGVYNAVAMVALPTSSASTSDDARKHASKRGGGVKDEGADTKDDDAKRRRCCGAACVIM